MDALGDKVAMMGSIMDRPTQEDWERAGYDADPAPEEYDAITDVANVYLQVARECCLYVMTECQFYTNGNGCFDVSFTGKSAEALKERMMTASQLAQALYDSLDEASKALRNWSDYVGYYDGKQREIDDKCRIVLDARTGYELYDSQRQQLIDDHAEGKIPDNEYYDRYDDADRNFRYNEERYWDATASLDHAIAEYQDEASSTANKLKLQQTWMEQLAGMFDKLQKVSSYEGILEIARCFAPGQHACLG